MNHLPLLGLLLALTACRFGSADRASAEAARALEKKYDAHHLRISAAGDDCLVLLVRSDASFDDATVESIQYGTDEFTAYPGGMQHFIEDKRLRAVVYRDGNGGLWTYGSITREEARSMPPCR